MVFMDTIVHRHAVTTVWIDYVTILMVHAQTGVQPDGKANFATKVLIFFSRILYNHKGYRIDQIVLNKSV